MSEEAEVASDGRVPVIPDGIAETQTVSQATLPEPGYEGDVILDVLQHYPQRRVMLEFDVQETPGPDRAALIMKFPDGPETRARDK